MLYARTHTHMYDNFLLLGVSREMTISFQVSLECKGSRWSLMG